MINYSIASLQKCILYVEREIDDANYRMENTKKSYDEAITKRNDLVAQLEDLKNGLLVLQKDAAII